MSDSLSVVMPVHNEAAHLPATIDALVAALDATDVDPQLVLVDDGSTDGSSEIVRRAVGDRIPLEVVAQANRGRFEARRAGIAAAGGELVLLLDGRVRLRKGGLAFVHARLAAGESVWNGHVYVDVHGNPYGAFWNALAAIAWRRYFDDPRTTSFGVEDFDHYPKGTTCFLAPRALLLEAFEAFRSRYTDLRLANDDTPLIRWIAERQRIHLSPEFSCDYRPRTTFRSFFRHSVHRGTVFLDGHGRRESRFYPVARAFFPVSAGLALVALRSPKLVPALAAGVGAGAGIIAAASGRPPFETASVAVLAPVYAVAHGAGMWRGLGLIARSRFSSGAPG
jgi:glycosyltransferase involved in cell wall biosynthesis